MLTAAILAGGRATRFGGRDKSALTVNGQSILDRQLAELSSIAGEILIIGGSAARGTRAIADIIPGCGPLGGLHAALSEARGDVTVVVACDMPYISAPLLAYLASLTAGADAAVPRTADGYHPLCAAYTRACLAPATEHLADGRLKLSDLLAAVRLRTVDVEELKTFGDHRRLLANVNTPADFEAAMQIHERL
jgi:molybdopterin-guanine dinucleotide biosynthesis protein A